MAFFTSESGGESLTSKMVALWLRHDHDHDQGVVERGASGVEKTRGDARAESEYGSHCGAGIQRAQRAVLVDERGRARVGAAGRGQRRGSHDLVEIVDGVGKAARSAEGPKVLHASVRV